MAEMTESKRIVILFGDDQESISDTLQLVDREQLATGMADLNYSRLDGKNLSDEKFSNAVMAMPFLVARRVVVLQNPLSLAGGKTGNQKFLKLLESIPDSTQLFLVIPDEIERKDWVLMGTSSFLRKWALKNSDTVELLEKRLPTPGSMREWIRKRAVAMGGQIETAAAQALAVQIGNDTREANQALEKLLLYVNYERPVDTMDVQELVSSLASVSVFDMVDALVNGNAKEAFKTLELLMEDQEIPMLFAMIVRQFRLLIQTREILDERGGPAQVKTELNQIPFVADKLCRQASGFSIQQLRDIYSYLVQMDFGFKTSQSDPKAALYVLIADVSLMVNR